MKGKSLSIEEIADSYMDHQEDLDKSIQIVTEGIQNIGEDDVDNNENVYSKFQDISEVDQHGRHELLANLRILKEEQQKLKSETTYLKQLVNKVATSQEDIQTQFEKGRGNVDWLNPQLTNIKSQLENTTTSFEARLDKLDKRLNDIITTGLHVPPFVVIMREFLHKKTKKIWWESQPFYSHPCGYKLHLEVRSGGYGAGAGRYVSVYIHLLCGEFDDQLPWPLSADVHFQLINHHLEGKNYSSKVTFTKDSEASRRVMDGRVAGTGRGYAQFVPHSALFLDQVKKTEFLKDDCLIFEISKVVLIYD